MKGNHIHYTNLIDGRGLRLQPEAPGLVLVDDKSVLRIRLNQPAGNICSFPLSKAMG